MVTEWAPEIKIPPNLDKSILKANEDFETCEQRNGIWPIAIHVGDLLISGGEVFIEYITRRMTGKSEVDSYAENESTYFGLKISKANGGNPDGIILDADKYDGEINNIGISHGRTRAPEEPSAEADQSILRSELGKLMWIARLARPGAIYDASADAQTFADGKLMGGLGKVRKLWRMGKGSFGRRKERRFRTHAWFCQIHGGGPKRMLTK